MQIILEQIINILFLFLGRYLIGYRTLIVAIIAGITGSVGLLSNFFAGFCEQFHKLCFISDPKVTAVILMWAAISGAILKKLDNMNISQP